jgi:hypothetical protein
MLITRTSYALCSGGTNMNDISYSGIVGGAYFG